MKTDLPEVHIKTVRGLAVVSSLDVAEKFSKPHKDVLKAIRDMDCSSEFAGRNFSPGSYIDDQNQRRPMVNMTKDGFSFLAMGFRGKKVAAWKEKYINAFSKMEEALRNRTEPRWIDDRKNGKLSRREETDAISDFVEYARGQGSSRANWYFKHYTSAVYRALFIVNDHFNGSFRDLLNSRQLNKLTIAEDLVTEIIRDGMAQGLFYKDIFQAAKSRLDALAAVVGVSWVVSPAMRLPTAGNVQQIEA